MYGRRSRQLTRLFNNSSKKRRVRRSEIEKTRKQKNRTELQPQPASLSPRANRPIRNRIIFTSWGLSLLLNVVMLFLLALLPQRFQILPEKGMQVDVISLPDQPTPKRRVVARRIKHVSQPIKISASQSLSAPARATPLTTHVRNIVRSPNEVALTTPDETMLADKINLPVDLVSRGNISIQNRPMTAGLSTSRTTGQAIDTPKRSESFLEKLRNEVGEAPQAEVHGSGEGVTGYYHIATVQYEDTADAMRAEALSRLVMGMNRWTNIRTQLLPESTPLADPAIQRIPLVYIAAKSDFSFSEKERANLRTYLQNGGTLLFSDVSPEWGTQGPVANSIRFELWKILGDNSNLRPIDREDSVCTSFFRFKKGVPRADKKRGEFYALWLDGRIAVFYDAAGLGLKWMEGNKNEKWLQWGVNLIVHTLVSAQPSH